jgi:hypothetical protein
MSPLDRFVSLTGAKYYDGVKQDLRTIDRIPHLQMSNESVPNPTR